MAQQTPPPPLTEMKLTDQIKGALGDPFGSGNFAIISYVDEGGQPNLSFRGSIHAHSDNQLALWARNPEGGLLKALKQNGGKGKVGIIYRNPNPDARAMLTFKGTGFTRGMQVSIPDVTVHDVTYVSPTQITAKVDMTASMIFT